MTFPKFLMLLSLSLFILIGAMALFKSYSPSEPVGEVLTHVEPLEIELDQQIQEVTPALATSSTEIAVNNEVPLTFTGDLPEANRIEELFNKTEPRLSIVETITYRSHVPWQKGRPAWLSDYASHYATSRHFIARSLNGAPEYLKQDLKEGEQFNVFRQDKNFQFYLVVDTSRCKMWFYYLDLDRSEKVLLKTYQVGLGRIEPSKASGLLTPLGKYVLGERVAVFKAKMMGLHQGKNKEMMTVFGTRWIPFEKEIGLCTAPAKGFGMHGTPWVCSTDQWSDNTQSIGKYESDGCIRLATPDIEELFAIIITKPTIIEIVRDFSEATFEPIQVSQF